MIDSSTPSRTPPDAPEGSIYKHMLRGSMWAMATNWGQRVLGLVNTIILARLLAPEDFGLVTMASLVLGFLNMFSEVGTGLHLLRQPEATREHCDTAWTIGVLRGLVVGALLAVLAPLGAQYFNEQRVIPIILILAINTVLVGGFNIGLVLIRKELDFFKDFLFFIISRVFLLFVTVGLALWLRSYWAIVFGNLIGTIFDIGLSYRIHPYRPRFSLVKAKEYVDFAFTSIPYFAAGYLMSRVDALVVGRSASAALLGIYNLSAELATMLTSDLTNQLRRALSPSFAKLLDDRKKLVEAYLNSVSGLAIMSIAFGFGLFAVSHDFVAVVLGSKWLDTIPLLEWLAIGGSIRAIGNSLGGGILLLSGHERAATVLMWIGLAVYAACSVAGMSLGGVHGVAIAMVLGAFAIIPISMAIVMRLYHLRIADYLRVLWRPLTAGIAMVLVIRLTHFSSMDIVALRLFADIIMGAVVFVLTLMGLWRLCGSPDGVEHMAIHSLAALWKGRPL
jgi:lipopolysaccharide exporter